MPIVKGWSFPVEVDKNTGKIKTADDNESIKQGIKMILQTSKYERLTLARFGTDIKQFLFREIDMALIKGITEEITEAIYSWVNHIRTLSVVVEPAPEYDSTVIVNISYSTDIMPNHIERITDKVDIGGMSDTY